MLIVRTFKLIKIKSKVKVVKVKVKVIESKKLISIRNCTKHFTTIILILKQS